MNRTLPQLRNLSEVHNFNEIRRISRWSPTKMQTLCNNAMSWKTQIGFRSRGKKVTDMRKNILEMLDENRRDLAEKSLHERKVLNLSFVKMVRLNDELSKKTGQVKVKRNKRTRKTDNSSELIVHFVTEVKEPEKIVTNFSVSLLKIEYYSYQKFEGFREGACLSSCDRVIFLHGGYAGQFNNNRSYLHQFDFTTKIWVQALQKGEAPTMSRIGQTVEEWKGNLYFIGGMGLNLFGKKRIYPNQLSVYNPDRGQWSKCKNLEGKRYHASIRFLHFIVNYGGINQKEEYLGNITVINLQSINSASTSFHLPEDASGIAYHKIISTMELEAKKRGDLVQDGVYCFGGKNNNGEFIDGLRVLNMEINSNGDLVPRSWTKLKTEGVGPKPRINHTMNLLPRLSSICVIGGQTDSNQVLKDIFLLNLHNLNWYVPQIMFDEVLMHGLSGHSSTVIGSKIYIFGGMQSNGKYSTSLVEVETDQNRIHTSAYQKIKKIGMGTSISQSLPKNV